MTAATTDTKKSKRQSYWRLVSRQFRRNVLAVMALVILATIGLIVPSSVQKRRFATPKNMLRDKLMDEVPCFNEFAPVEVCCTWKITLFTKPTTYLNRLSGARTMGCN